MSLGSKLKDFFTKGGCVIEEPEKINIESIVEALELIKTLRGRDFNTIGRKVNALLTQLVGWVDLLQQDMNIIKASKLRTIAHDIAEIKIQLLTMTNEINTIKESHKEPEVVVVEEDLIGKIKDTVKKIKIQKEKKDGNK